MPRSFSSRSRSGSIPVSASISVDFPWSTCPAVPTVYIPHESVRAHPAAFRDAKAYNCDDPLTRNMAAAFTVQSFHDLVRLLEAQPEWRAELRRLVLTEDLLTLPDLVRELVEAQRRSEERLAALETRTAAVEDRMAAVESRMVALVEAQGRAEEQLADLAKAQRQTQESLDALIRRSDRIESRLDEMRGDFLELRYRNRFGAYFGRILRRVRLVSPEELDDILEEGQASGALDEDTASDVRLADLIVRGRRKTHGQETHLVVEVSVGVGHSDVERAVRRASLLNRVRPAVPAIAGEWISNEAGEHARQTGVWQVLDGRIVAPAGE